MNRSWRIALIGAAVLCATAATAVAQVPGTIPFTGRLSDGSGPVDGSISISFAIFDSDVSTTEVWSESYPTATATQGLVFINLGSKTTLDATVFNSGVKYLEVTVNGTTLTPRLPIGSVPYAMRAGVADNADSFGGLAPADYQARVTGTCASGAVSQVNADGTVTCVSVGTSYSGTSPITVNGTNIGLSSSGCSNGQALKYNGSTFACANDADTTYAGSAPITVSGNTVSLSTSGCATGQALKYNGSAFACANDTNTTYSGTAPITVSGSTISLSTNGCSSGQVLKYNGATFACAADNNTGTTYSQGTGISISSSTISVDGSVVARKDAAAGDQAFDTNTLYLDYTNNAVGVGTSTPGQPLDVNGNAQATDFLYATPRTAYKFIPAGSMNRIGTSGTWSYTGLGGQLTSGLQQTLSAPVDLPSGATITALDCYLKDNDAGSDSSGTVSLYGWGYGDGNGVSNLGSVSLATTGTSASTQTMTSALSTTVDNSTGGIYLYVVYKWVTNVTNGGNYFFGCRLTYTMSRAGS